MSILYTKQFEIQAIYNVPLIETENFKVIPSLGSLVEGWVLIVPKKHYLSFGYMESYLFEELNYLHNKVISILQQLYNKEVIVFENGSLDIGTNIGCGVDYAHIHYVPIEIEIKKLVDEFYSGNLKWEKISYMSSLRQMTENLRAYMFIEDNNRNKYLCEITQPISQLVRKIIAKYIGNTEKYDWKKFYFEDNIFKTIERFETVLKSEKEFSLV